MIGLKTESGRYRCRPWWSFDYDELVKRDKVNLDIFWLKDKSLEDSDDLPAPDVLAQEIADDLQTALEHFQAIAEKVKGYSRRWPIHAGVTTKRTCRMEGTEAVTFINTLIEEADLVRRDRTKFDGWRRKCHAVLDRIFGKDSRQAEHLSKVTFRFTGVRQLGDNRPLIQAFENGIEKSKEVLRSYIWEIEKFGMPDAVSQDATERAWVAIEMICNHFHAVARQLRARHDDRPTLDVTDEYDVQDLLHALFRLYFDDIRPEEWTPSYAGSSARMDFLLKTEEIVVEVKKTRKGLVAKKLGEELTIDIAHYKTHSNCKTLICFIYDPENRIANPAGLENDLSRKDDDFTVTVIVSPKT